MVEPEFPCQYCSRKFQTERGRNVHVGRKHKVAEDEQDESMEDNDDYEERFYDDDDEDEEEQALDDEEFRLARLELDVDQVLARMRRGRYADKLSSFQYEPMVAAWNKPYELTCRRNKVALLQACEPYWDPNLGLFKLPPKELLETLLDSWNDFNNEFHLPVAVEEELTQKRLRYDWAVAMAVDNPWWTHLITPDLDDELLSVPSCGWVTQQIVLTLLRIPKEHQDPIRLGLLTAVINCFILQYGAEVTEILLPDSIFLRAVSCVKCKPEGPGVIFWCVYYYLEAEPDDDWFEGYLAEKRLPPVGPATKAQLRADTLAFIAETKTRPPGKPRRKGGAPW